LKVGFFLRGEDFKWWDSLDEDTKSPPHGKILKNSSQINGSRIKNGGDV
jgi:hypothetical protein